MAEYGLFVSILPNYCPNDGHKNIDPLTGRPRRTPLKAKRRTIYNDDMMRKELDP